MAKEIIGYKIIDRKTGFQVGSAKSLKGARRSIDKRDNEYGAYRFGYEPVYEGEE